eukprot:COSAG02_NODE_796_length_17128_cov_176.587586_16_plen_80_part_00
MEAVVQFHARSPARHQASVSRPAAATHIGDVSSGLSATRTTSSAVVVPRSAANHVAGSTRHGQSPRGVGVSTRCIHCAR